MDRTLWAEARVVAARHGGRGGSDHEDLAQDLVVAALEGGAAAARPGAWLERVGRNAAIDRWRVESRREVLAKEIEPPAQLPDPEAALLGRERRGLVRRALSALPRAQRRAAIARFHAELPFETVAERLGTEPATARTRVHRALANLRARLGGLRAMFVFPGAQATALGLTLLATEAPGLRAPAVASVVIADADIAAEPAPARRRAVPVVVDSSATTPARLPAPPPARDARPATKAPPAPAPPAPSPAPQVFEFDNDTIEGGFVGPDGVLVPVLGPVAQPSLIELRRHFVAEMLKSMEEM